MSRSSDRVGASAERSSFIGCQRILSVCAVVFCLQFTAFAEQSSTASEKALQSAAAKGSLPAAYALGAGAESAGDFEHAREWYEKAADGGYAPAQWKLGQLLESG